jgi:hypothetical protein
MIPLGGGFLWDVRRWGGLTKECRMHAMEPDTSAQHDPIARVALAWLPPDDYEQAIELWPEFAGSARVAGPDGPLPHRQYCRVMQGILIEYAEGGIPGLAVAALRVAPFTEWCAEKAYDPDTAEARAEFAAQLARTDGPDVVSWPPGRNEPCWCGSGRKYKKCCAASSFVDAS